MANRSLKDIISKESVLISAHFSPSTEKQLYGTVFESFKVSGINSIVWVCYQHTPDILEDKLKSYGFTYQNIRFIDMISHMMGLTQEMKNTIYCVSPTDYNCLFRSIDKILDERGSSLIVIDNLNALLSYDPLERVIKTLRSLNNRIPQKDSAILYLEITGASAMQTEVAIKTTMNHVLQINGTGERKNNSEWDNFNNITWHDVFSLKAPIMFSIVVTMIFIVIFLSSLLIYVILKTGV